MERIVSLLPSLTEIVCALGLEECLVGRSHECDHPPGIERLPVLTRPKLDPEKSSREIDDDVVRLVREGLSVYRVEAERLRDLRPDVILTQDHCEVCAASLRDVEAAVCDWVGGRPRLVSLSPSSLADVWGDFQRVSDALGVPDRGRALVRELTDRVTAMGEATGGLPDPPSVACIEWIDPLMAAGNWMPELVHLAGGRNLFGATGQHSPRLEWEALRAADPDLLLVLPCGFDLPRTRAEMAPLSTRPGWRELSAVRSGRVFLTDGNRYFNRPGPRLVESLEILAEILHPERFDFGHAGDGFERY